MDRKAVKRILGRGAAALGSYLPGETDLLFPILYSACVWAGRRVFNYRDHLVTWKSWLDPKTVRTKPDGFILDFFEKDKALREFYSEEIRRRDMKALREAFRALYPVRGLEDAFLIGLFRNEMAAGDFRKIAADFENVVSRAREGIRGIEKNPDFWKFLEGLGIEIASLDIHRFADEEVRTLIAEAIRKAPEPGPPAWKED